MKILFVHSVRMWNDGNFHYTINLSKQVWETRYLPYCDELTVMGRDIVVPVTPVGKMISDCPNVHFSGIPANNLMSAYLKKHTQTIEIIQKNVCESDLVILRMPYSLSSAVVKACKKYNKPYLVEVVGCAWDAYRTHSKKGALLAPIMAAQMRKTVRQADFALYVTKSFLQKRYPCNGLCCACSDVKLMPLEAERYETRLQRCQVFSYEKPISLATIGAVNVQYKGQEYVIRAMAKLKQEGYAFVYRVIGGGGCTALQELAERLGVADSVIFMGNLTHEQVFKTLDETDIYVHPSLTEGLPRSVLEAESRGCAVLGTNVGGIPEIVPAENLFEKKDVDGIAALLCSYTPERLAAEAQRNIQFAEAFAAENSDKVRDAFMKKVRTTAQKD